MAREDDSAGADDPGTGPDDGRGRDQPGAAGSVPDPRSPAGDAAAGSGGREHGSDHPVDPRTGKPGGPTGPAGSDEPVVPVDIPAQARREDHPEQYQTFGFSPVPGQRGAPDLEFDDAGWDARYPGPPDDGRPAGLPGQRDVWSPQFPADHPLRAFTADGSEAPHPDQTGRGPADPQAARAFASAHGEEPPPEHGYADAVPDEDAGPSDAELADRVRRGDDSAYELLYARHVVAVRRMARACARTAENAEDLVGETFTRTLQALRGGHGPREATRPYLLTTVRRVAGDWARNDRRMWLTDDMAAVEAGAGVGMSTGVGLGLTELPEDPAVLAVDCELAARAFEGLPERWRAVLWYTEVEREKPARVAPKLGVSPNALVKLKERARDGLRAAYLTAYADHGVPEECRPFAKDFGAFVRGRLGSRAAGAVGDHLDVCDRCRIACLELCEVSTCMRLVAGGLLGPAALAYLGAAAAAAATATGIAVTAGAGAGTGAAVGGSSGGGGASGTAANQGAQTAVRVTLLAGAAVAVAAVAWALVANDAKDPTAAPMPPAMPPASAPMQVPPPPPVPVPPTPSPEPPKPAPPQSVVVPPKPQPTPTPTPKPVKNTPTPTVPPKKPVKPKPKPTITPPLVKGPRVTVRPTQITVNNGTGGRVVCNGKAGGWAGPARCDQVTVDLPVKKKQGSLMKPGCTTIPAAQGRPEVKICRR